MSSFIKENKDSEKPIKALQMDLSVPGTEEFADSDHALQGSEVSLVPDR